VEDGQVHEPASARALGLLKCCDCEGVLLRVERRRDHKHELGVLKRRTDSAGVREIGLGDLAGTRSGRTFTASGPVYHGTDSEWSRPQRLQQVRTAHSGRADYREQWQILAIYGS